MTHSIASSFDFTWINQKPATSSLVSVKLPFTCTDVRISYAARSYFQRIFGATTCGAIVKSSNSITESAFVQRPTCPD